MSDADALRAAWTLHVPDGLGRLCLGLLRPGMTREDVAVVAAPHGPVERVEDHGTRTAGIASGFEGIETFGFTPEEIAAARAAWGEVKDATRDIVTEDRGLGEPSLDYVGDRLARVATDHHCARLTLLGRPVYADDPLALLAALEELDGGEVLREGDTVWFPRLGVTLMGFYGDWEDGTVGPFDDPPPPASGM